ncbi:MAG: hypothetical protein QOJ02_3621 [Acidobacteriota bacterium]|jgi:hypothetical protein|nr:hypothetical protein [Acidobacteriota bacterium]
MHLCPVARATGYYISLLRSFSNSFSGDGHVEFLPCSSPAAQSPAAASSTLLEMISPSGIVIFL